MLHRFKSFAESFILSSFGRFNVEDQADTEFSNRSWWVKFLNKTRATKTHPINQNRMFCATQRRFMNTFGVFLMVKNRGKSWEVHIVRRDGPRVNPLQFSIETNTEAFVGDPVQIQTEKSGSQRGLALQTQTFRDFFLTKDFWLIAFFWGS